MSKLSSEGPQGRSTGDSPRETFTSFCRRLFQLTLGDPRSWIACAAVDSTSSQARRFLTHCRASGLSPVPPACFLAWEQSAGRGRGGRDWSSPPGLGLYMTFLLPGLTTSTTRQLPLALAVLVARVIESFGVKTRIKWPNDVLAGGRKLAGILLESSSGGAGDSRTLAGATLAGIGINVHHSQETLPFPEASSMALEGATELDMAALATGIGHSIDDFLARSTPMAEIIRDYMSWSQHSLGDRLRCRQEESFIEGEFAGFDEDGSLLLDRGGRIVKLASSEIVQL